MSFNLKDELKKLSNTAPVLKDLDEYSDDETKAKVDQKSKEYEDELDYTAINGSNRKIRRAIGDLSEFGARYKGKMVSRKQLDDESEIEEDQEIDEEFEDEENEQEDDEEEDEDLEDEDEEGESEEEEDEDEDDDEKPKVKKQKKNQEEKDQNGINVMNFNQKEEIEKGKAVKNQLKFWDTLLESRIKLQNVLNKANLFPQHDCYEKIINNLSDDYKKKNEPVVNENKEYLVKIFNQLIELQQRMLVSNPETNYIVKELNLEKLEEDKSDEKEEKPTNLKRKRINSEGSSEESEDQEDEKEDKEEDEDDEEIYSDTDEEMKADEIRKTKKLKKISDFKFNPLKEDQFEEYLEKFNKSFQKYRNSTIQKWYDKTRLTSGKSFAALEKPILQQIEHILLDKERIVKRTQLKRGDYKIIGLEEVNKEENEDSSKDRHLKDYDEEIFDDQDFYNQLLRELIDRKSSNISDPVELSRKSIELQKLRSKNKKNVDTKASKGRKIKFDIHKPLVNFMAPIFRSTMPEEAKNELFRSLFGNHVTLSTSDKNRLSNNDNVDFSAIFKGF